MQRILVINGPNLSKLGIREAEHYGSFTLSDLEEVLLQEAALLKVDLDFFQSDTEGELVSNINNAGQSHSAVLINAGAYTHTSIAIRDALSTSGLPYAEVHISNVYRREDFRHKSLLSDLAVGVVVGFGMQSYIMGLKGLIYYLKANPS